MKQDPKGDPLPTRIAPEQQRLLALVSERTGRNRSELLRLCLAYFLHEFGDKPEEVQRLYLQYKSVVMPERRRKNPAADIAVETAKKLGERFDQRVQRKPRQTH